MFKKFKRSEKGQGMVEYGLILALVSIVALGALGGIGGKVSDTFNKVVGVVSGGEVIPDVSEGPIYTDEQVDDLVKKEGYIPIATPDELNNLRKSEEQVFGQGTKWEYEYTSGLDKEYIQVADVDLSGYSEGEGWAPIGNNFAKFTGSFDGNGYSITGLTIDRSTSYVGLFGYTEEATISNVALEGISVKGNDSVGGLVGVAENYSKISNSYVTGSVTGTWGYVGGLVGEAYDVTVSNSYATGLVKGTSRVGGLVGYNDGSISNSYTTGAVEGTGLYVGGLVGEIGYTTVTNSYATGLVKGTSRVGGLVGYAKGGTTTISSSYATGSVTGTGTGVGGLVGEASMASKISNSNATGKVTGKENVGGLVGAGRTEINTSYATGSVTGTGDKVGGLVGYAENYSKISNSYATGSVSGTKEVAGLVGKAYGSVTIGNSYATGSVTGEGTGWQAYVGGLVGRTAGSDSRMASNSYWDKETTGESSSAASWDEAGKTTEEMKTEGTYTGWDFVNVWKIDEGNDYPKLR